MSQKKKKEKLYRRAIRGAREIEKVYPKTKELSFCPECYSMTNTIIENGEKYCGKCLEFKGEIKEKNEAH